MNLELLAELEREQRKFSKKVRLVWSGPIFNEMADNTAPVIHEMVNSAKKTITIIGYWLWNEENVEEIIESFIEKTLSCVKDTPKDIKTKTIIA